MRVHRWSTVSWGHTGKQVNCKKTVQVMHKGTDTETLGKVQEQVPIKRIRGCDCRYAR